MDKIFESFMSNFAGNMSVIVSLVSVITAFISTTVASLRASKDAIKLKRMELSYEKQLQAYSSYLAACAELSLLLTQEQVAAMDNAYSVALLFASKRTHELLKEHFVAVHQAVTANFLNLNNKTDLTNRANDLRASLARSMHDDLRVR